MASITKRIVTAADPDVVWAALRDVGNSQVPFAPVVTAVGFDGEHRDVTLANGVVVRERIVAVDDEHRRLAYTAVDGLFTHHHSSFQVTGDGNETTVTWITDLLPDDYVPLIEAFITEAAAALEANLAR